MECLYYIGLGWLAINFPQKLSAWYSAAGINTPIVLGGLCKAPLAGHLGTPWIDEILINVIEAIADTGHEINPLLYEKLVVPGAVNLALPLDAVLIFDWNHYVSFIAAVSFILTNKKDAPTPSWEQPCTFPGTFQGIM